MNELEKAFAAIEALNIKPVVWSDGWGDRVRGCLVVEDELREAEDVVHGSKAGGV